MAKRLRCEALAKTTCEPEDKREGGRRKRRRRSKWRPEWKKRARLNGVGGGVVGACLLCERLKVSLIFPTITPPVFLLVARLLFAKLKGPTPSRSRHHPRGAALHPFAQGGIKGGWRASAFSHPSSKNATDGETSGTDTVSLLATYYKLTFRSHISKNYRKE